MSIREQYHQGGWIIFYMTKYLIELDYPEVRDTKLYYEKWGDSHDR